MDGDKTMDRQDGQMRVKGQVYIFSPGLSFPVHLEMVTRSLRGLWRTHAVFLSRPAGRSEARQVDQQGYNQQVKQETKFHLGKVVATSPLPL